MTSGDRGGDTFGRWGARARVAFLAFAAIAIFLLFAEHRVHVFPYLPWLLLAACPLLHLFMHGRHHHRRHGTEHREGDASEAPATSDPAPGSPRDHSVTHDGGDARG